MFNSKVLRFAYFLRQIYSRLGFCMNVSNRKAPFSLFGYTFSKRESLWNSQNSSRSKIEFREGVSSALRREIIFTVYDVFQVCLWWIHRPKRTFHKGQNQTADLNIFSHILLQILETVYQHLSSHRWHSRCLISSRERFDIDVIENNFRKWAFMTRAVKRSAGLQNAVWNHCNLSFRSYSYFTV